MHPQDMRTASSGMSTYSGALGSHQRTALAVYITRQIESESDCGVCDDSRVCERTREGSNDGETEI